MGPFVIPAVVFAFNSYFYHKNKKMSETQGASNNAGHPDEVGGPPSGRPSTRFAPPAVEFIENSIYPEWYTIAKKADDEEESEEQIEEHHDTVEHMDEAALEIWSETYWCSVSR